MSRIGILLILVVAVTFGAVKLCGQSSQAVGPWSSGGDGGGDSGVLPDLLVHDPEADTTLAVRAGSAQTSNLFEVQNSAGGVLIRLDTSATVFAGTIRSTFGRFVLQSTNAGLSNATPLRWSNASDVFAGSYDTGLDRNAPGVLRVTNGSTGIGELLGATASEVVAFTATPTFNAAASQFFELTLTAAVTASTLSNAVTGQRLTFKICQDATGGHAFAWPVSFSGADAINAAAGTCTLQEFIVSSDGQAYAVAAARSG